MELSTLRHSLAHVMAMAISEKRPESKLAIGPSIESGFYYDFKFQEEFSDHHLKEIEKKMKHLIKMKIPFEQYDLPIQEALVYYDREKNPYKSELILDLEKKGEKTVSFYKLGNFIDLCKGPHLQDTGQIPLNIFKLDKVTGAYWRGDEKNEMLTRIYGLAFNDKEALEQYIARRKEAALRDHRKLGIELKLFNSHDEIGPGLITWRPKGARIRSIIEDFWRKEHFKNGYELIYTPHIGKGELWTTSGHLDFYKENMYSSMKIDEIDYYLKPMNCPFHIMAYKSERRSYRELPLRWAELGTVYRYERSGVLHGLLRVRGFTQDDAHIICTPEQIEDEILTTLKFSLSLLKAFGFKNIKAYLATRPEHCVGEMADWDKAISSLKKAISKEGLECEIDEGGGAFYGPKIDLKVLDVLEREWQLTTIQFDFNLPTRFKMLYMDADGQEKRPFMVHRALLGSLERFFGILIEHYAGAFPPWLAPEQINLLSVNEKFNPKVKEIERKLQLAEIRCKSDLRNESLGKKIREGRLRRVPYLGIIGEQEVENGTITVRNHHSKKQTTLLIDKFVDLLTKEDKDRKISPEI